MTSRSSQRILHSCTISLHQRSSVFNKFSALITEISSWLDAALNLFNCLEFMLDHDPAIFDPNQRWQNCCARIYGEAGQVLMLFTSTQQIELIARKNHMKAVMLTVQKRNISAMNFYTSKLRYTISSISPSWVDPLIGAEKSYENFTRTLPSAFYYFSNAVFEKMRHLSSTRSTRQSSPRSRYHTQSSPHSIQLTARSIKFTQASNDSSLQAHSPRRFRCSSTQVSSTQPPVSSGSSQHKKNRCRLFTQHKQHGLQHYISQAVFNVFRN